MGNETKIRKENEQKMLTDERMDRQFFLWGGSAPKVCVWVQLSIKRL